jgi:hypothetical protein
MSYADIVCVFALTDDCHDLAQFWLSELGGDS